MSQIQEGFLCPICMTDLGDVIQLQVHFDEKHSKEDDQAFVQNLKDFFGKAKRKIERLGNSSGEDSHLFLIQGSNNNNNASSASGHPVSGIRYDAWPEPLMLEPNSHEDRFLAIRRKQSDRRAFNTSQIIVRLEKLLNNAPSETLKRRQHEQSVVSWIPEESVNRCPECTKSFGLAWRKHHCRLCGSIMCTPCSFFVPFETARRVVNPTTLTPYLTTPENDDSGPPKGTPKSTKLFGLRRTHSKESIVSLLDSKSGEQHFRSCIHCYTVVNNRDSKIEQETGEPPILVQFYDRLRNFMVEAESLSTEYGTIVDSLYAGEEDYQLEEGKRLRLKIMKSAENIDFISKKILNHNLKEEEEEEPSMATTLQRRIRQMSVTFIKDTLVGFRDVPTESEYEELRQKRVNLAATRIEDQKRSALMARIKYEQKRNETPGKSMNNLLPNPSSIKGSESPFCYDEGFVLSPNSSFVIDNKIDDPILQQMSIISGFIQQAANAKRFDEVEMLENNLKELQIELQRSQTDQKQLMENYNSFKHVFKSNNNGSNVTEETTTTHDDYDASGKNPFF